MWTRVGFRPLAAVGAAALVSATIGVSAQSTAPVVYQGLRHTALGQAVLQPNPGDDALDVRTFDPAGGDGVAVDLGTAATWTARLATIESGDPFAMSFGAVADGRRISAASLRQAGDRLAIGATFTGATTPTYAIHVYNQGRLVGSLGGQPPTARTHVQLPCEFFENGCNFWARFRNTYFSECEWGFVFGAAAPIALPNGKVLTGNEVRLTEEVRPAGHYPYLSFDGVTMQTNARTLRLLSESAR